MGYGRVFVVLVVLAGVLSGCYQTHSDDALHTVPATNNPNILPPGSRSMALPAPI